MGEVFEVKYRISNYILLAQDLLEEDVNTGTSPTPEEVTEYLKGCASNGLPEMLDYFHQRWPNEKVWPPGTALSNKLKHFYLRGGVLLLGTVLPAGLKHLYFGGGTILSGTDLPEGLQELYLGGGALPFGTVIPSNLIGHDLDGYELAIKEVGYVFPSIYEPEPGILLDVDSEEDIFDSKTLQGGSFLFIFIPTYNMELSINQYCSRYTKYELAPVLFSATLGGNYNVGLLHVRISANQIDNNGKKLWIVENIQSDFMMRLGALLVGHTGKARLEHITGYPVSNQKAHNAVDFLYRLFKDWPHWAMDFVEEAARQNGIDSIIFTNSKIQTDRWTTMSKETADKYYEELPEGRGYKKIDAKLFGRNYKGLWEKEVGV